MRNISVFANFYINDKERFFRMRDSFMSFQNASIARWIINVRGNYKTQSINFFKKKLKRKKHFLFKLDSGDWFKDTIKLTKLINTHLVFFWTEDHVCLRNVKKFDSIVKDMRNKNIDYLQYSWFINGLGIKSLESVNYKQTKNIIFFNYTKKVLNKRLEWFKKNQIDNHLLYIISQQSIMKSTLFRKILNIKEFSFFKKNLPFAFEKNHRFTNWLPYKIALVKKEFFASIDDDVGHKNYSLISRGLYKDRLTKKQKIIIEKKRINSSDRYNLWGQIYYSNFFKLLKKMKKLL